MTDSAAEYREQLVPVSEPVPDENEVGVGPQQSGYRAQQPGRTLADDPGRAQDRPGFDPKKNPVTKRTEHTAEFNPTTETLHSGDATHRTR